jgi:hypothetical protein
MRCESSQREPIDVVIRAANRVRLYLYGSWQAPRSPRGIYGGYVCVTDAHMRASDRGIVGPHGS